MMYRLLLLPFIFLLCISLSAQATLARYPTIDEVASYLRVHLTEAPNGFISYFWVDEEALGYADLNGDGEVDLIAQGWLFVAVMLWEGNSYSDPLQIIYTANTDSGAWSHIELQDWTLDGISDITFDRRIPINGNEFSGNYFYRSIISCELLCYVAWEGQIAEYLAVESEQGMYLSQSEMSVSENATGRIVLDVITEDFAFNCRHTACAVAGEVIDQDGFQARSRIGSTLRTRYLWDGLEFLYSDTLILIDPHIMPSQSQLLANNDEGRLAQIIVDEQCQLWLDALAIGEAFACIPDFTKIYWHDVYWVLEYAYFTEETMVLYNISGNELFRLSGAIRDTNLFGLRLVEQTVFSTGGRYSDVCPNQLCWFTLNDAILTMELSP